MIAQQQILRSAKIVSGEYILGNVLTQWLVLVGLSPSSLGATHLPTMHYLQFILGVI